MATKKKAEKDNKDLQTIEQPTEVGIFDGFEANIAAHEKALNFVPDMSTEESRTKSRDLLKEARADRVLIDQARKDKKKEAEKLSKVIHATGTAATDRLEKAYKAHKVALDNYRKDQKAIEDRLKQKFNDACDWLIQTAAAAQFATAAQIEEMIALVEEKDQDSTGEQFTNNQKFEYGKSRMAMQPKLEKYLNEAIIREAEDAKRTEEAAALAEQQETLRAAQEELQRNQQAETTRQAAQAAAEKTAKNARKQIEQAERDKKAQEEQAERNTKQALIDAEAAQLKAVEDEKNRALRENQAKLDELTRLAANREHSGKIHRGILAELIAKGFDENQAKTAVGVMISSPLIQIIY